jgi:hypothetical protein
METDAREANPPRARRREILFGKCSDMGIVYAHPSPDVSKGRKEFMGKIYDLTRNNV